MADVEIELKNDVLITCYCDQGITMEMHEYFSFYAKGYKFMPAFKNHVWDGKLRMFNKTTQTIYAGLVHEVIRFCLDRSYTIKLDKALGLAPTPETDVSGFISSLNLPFTPYDYQEKALQVILDKKRRLVLSPTSSGKTALCYMVMRYLLEKNLATKILFLTPSTSLVEQFFGDCDEYAQNDDTWCSEDHINKIYDFKGMTKDSDKQICASTWQSVFRMPKKWFGQFDCCIVDEAHTAKASSIKSIMERMTNCPYKIGMTGTIDDCETNKLVLQGLFGKIYKTTTTKELMDKGVVSKLTIKAMVLNYPDHERKVMAKMKYQDEIDTIISDRRRNNLIHRLACTQDGNVLVLFNRVEGHGIPLAEQMTTESNGRKILVVHGKIKTKERDDIRKYAELHNNVVIVASYGTFSQGISVRNLQYLIFAQPYKSRIKNLQSIGRGLRISKESSDVTLYDIADNYKWKSKTNTTMRHFKTRLRMYDAEEFDYKLINLEMK